MDELKEKLNGFDWFYMFSDDSECWKKWNRIRNEIQEWAKTNGLTNEQVLEAVASKCDDHHVIKDWTKK